MSTSIQVIINTSNEQVTDELIASLSVLEVDGFEEKGNQLICYYTEGKVDGKELSELIEQHNVDFTTAEIQERNWNEVWESSFSPVVVGDFCAIRADFHSPVSNPKYEIIITPKMSFGTGHHATTYLMVQQMEKLDLRNKQVADFGTGTGILAILAEKLGSTYIWAVDNDDWSIENTRENIERNKCEAIKVEKVNSFEAPQKFDIILANINKNTILQNLPGLIFGLNAEGKTLISGLLKQDEEEVLLSFKQHNFIHLNTVERDNWISMLFATSD